jgi:branched-chain amino acid transport system ATP-binding protein
MIEVRDVHASYDAVLALRGVTIEVTEGEIVCLLGANGAGKSTTLRVISGLVRPTSGEVLYYEEPIHHMTPESIVKLGISHVPEGRRILPGLTVRENMILGASARKNLSKKELKNDMDKMFDLFPDLDRLKDALGWTLSGGQQQMLGIARGLMANPKVLMMDEPSLGLAPILFKEVFRTIKEINETIGTTVLLVEQNASLALSIAHCGYVIENGKVVLSGTAKELLKNPQIRDAYLGGRN